MKRTPCFKTGLFAAGLAAGLALAAALPSDARAAGGRPRIDFKPGEFGVAVVGQGNNAASYYLPYTLTNPMDEARTPRIHIEARTDSNKTYGDHVDVRVLEAAKKALKVDKLETASSLRSKEVAAGASVQALANFGAIDPNADGIDVRVYGLWDPIVRTRQGKVFKENRVLVLRCERRGDEYGRPADPIRIVSRREEVEGDLVELYSTGTAKK